MVAAPDQRVVRSVGPIAGTFIRAQVSVHGVITAILPAPERLDVSNKLS